MAGEDVEDFGAGIETPNTAQTPVVDQSTPAADEFMTQFRGLVDGIPDGINRDQVADYLVEIQSKASRAEELERQNAEYQAQLALVARKGTTADEAESEAPPAASDEFELPWKPVKVDPQFRSYVVADPESGGFLPKNPASTVHLAAAEEMNRRAQYERQFADDLFNDPEAAIAHLTRRQLAAMRKEYDEKLQKLQEQLQPLHQDREKSQAEQEFMAWQEKNVSKLWTADNKLTPIGSAVEQILKNSDLTPDQALAVAESLNPAAPSAPAAPAAPAAAPVKTKFQKPNRLVDEINQNQRRASQPPADRRTYDGGSGRWKSTFEDLDERIKAQYGE